MEAAGLAFTLVTVFKDTYLTVKFIRNTLQTLKGFEEEQREIATSFTVQIWFLRNLSRLFCVANSNKVDFELLEGVSDDYLLTVRDVFRQHQRVLSDYRRTAEYLDSDYKRFLDLNRQSKVESIEEAWVIEEEDASRGAPKTLLEDPSILSNAADSASPKRPWFQRYLLGSGKQSSPKAAQTSKSTRLPKVEFTLPPNVRWLFKKNELQRTLDSLKRWNGELRDLIGPLLDAFGFFRNLELQKRLQSDGTENIFKGHLTLNSLAIESQTSAKESETPKDSFVSLETAMARVVEPKILAEYKRLTEWKSTENVSQPDFQLKSLASIKELYGPQLARLLHAAGIHSFRTLPLHSYTWDGPNSRYIYLFNYPEKASSRKPKSLDDLIRSDDSRYKLELQQRFFVAQTVAKAIGAFHADGWLHKNIRAHAIKFFFDQVDNTCDFSNPYLTDFEFSRPVQGLTRLLPQALDMEHEVYRHPDRHGMPGIGFNKMHDIYSLGVVLLEIGIWTTAKQLYDDVVLYDYGGTVPATGLPPMDIRDMLVQEAKKRLAHRMGKAYMEAVVSCLDDDWHEYVNSQELAKEFYDRVIQKVDLRAFAF